METCIHFKPQRADDKHPGCVQTELCSECEGCAYVAPEVKAEKKVKAERKAKAEKKKAG